VLRASALFHAAAAAAAAAGASHTLALAGFLLWLGGLAFLLLAFTVERSPAASRRAAQVVEEAAVAALF
jgi:predicted phage tail protein